jgi:hypothetical protein
MNDINESANGVTAEHRKGLGVRQQLRNEMGKNHENIEMAIKPVVIE